MLAMRQSPDWHALARDHARGTAIEPDQFLPRHPIPTFPPGIENYVRLWNATFRIDFFAVRAELKDIARETHEAVAGAVRLNAAELPNGLPTQPFRLFFHDDDDWFAPDMATHIAATGGEDVAVFSLPRIGLPVATFVWSMTRDSQIVGMPSRPAHRYHTNNYGLHPRLCVAPTLGVMVEHKDASAAAAALGLIDGYYDVIVSATNKTPVAASVMESMALDADAFRGRVAAFVTMGRALGLPPGAAWMAEPLRQTVKLFERALG